MVRSQLQPTKIQYNESSEIDPDDFKHETYEHEVRQGNTRIPVVFGKIKKTHIGHKVLYCSMYSIIEGQDATRIGILEFPSDKASQYTDDNGGFVCEDENIPFKPLFFVKVATDKKNEMKSGKIPDTKDDIFTLKMPTEALTSQSKTFIFGSPIVPSLPEETKEDSRQAKDDYTTSPSDCWVAKFMHNKNYKLHEVGGCILASVFNALNTIGKTITIEQMRELLANQTTEENFHTRRDAFLKYEDEHKSRERIIGGLKDTLTTYKNRVKKATNLTTIERQQIVLNAKKIKEDITVLLNENRKNELFAKQYMEPDFTALRSITTPEQYKEFIKSTRFCPSVQAVERVLNIKLIVLDEDAFNDKAEDSVLHCGQPDTKPMSPFCYIIVSRRKYGYHLVSYKNKQAFAFSEVPYDIKMLILNKCMENNAGSYQAIPDIRNLQLRLGMRISSSPSDEEQQPKIVFMIGPNAPRNALPGCGSGECIPLDERFRYIQLIGKPWRQMLDDSDTQTRFTMGRRFASVENAYQSRKFINGYPDFAELFAENANSPFSTDARLAKIAGGPKPNEYRPKNVVIDRDFYGERCFKDKFEALKAKFSQNMDAQAMLVATHPAHIVEFVRGRPPEIRHDLMRLRDMAMTNNL